jgi:hypothetical protein
MTHETEAPISEASFSKASFISVSRWNVILWGFIAGLLAMLPTLSDIVRKNNRIFNFF